MNAMDAIWDLLGSYRHSRYFCQTRAFHINKRIRLLALLTCFAQPAWILVDSLLLPDEILPQIALARLISGLVAGGLWWWTAKPYHMPLAKLRIASLVGVLLVFQVTSNVLLWLAGYSQQVAGYNYLPYMIISLIAIFPLTLFETLAYTLVVIGVELSLQYWQSSLGSVAGLNALWLIAVLAAIAIWAAVNQLHMLLSLYRQATRDPLTGLANRRQAMAQLESDIQLCHEQGQALTLLMFDLDHFKQVNDRYGHATGDIVLRAFSQILRQQLRPRLDLAARHGGEEFIAILPGQALSTARELAESIRQACEQAEIETPEGELLGFTTSIGVAQLNSQEGHEQLLNRADLALYQAKDNGRNRLAIAA